MTTLVVGASGATGCLLVEQLLKNGQKVKIVVRSIENLPDNIKSHKDISIIQASILNLSDSEMIHHVKDCDALASCLGHNLSFKGIFGSPHRLVTDAVNRLCNAVKASSPKALVKFVLMNTTGNRNRDLKEQISFGQKCVILLLRLLLPPHVDNENAADYLRTQIGQNNDAVEWSVVRPDNLIDESNVTDYEVHPSPIRSAIFDSGTTSRINVGHFMAKLITDNDTWNEWKGKMPMIYNKI
ncbi:MAG: SDR family oxidoreductase [Gammaproteobacteria bacterium]|nr:SDR family oxidoreductase [Gammaproteobacteria bacterium]